MYMHVLSIPEATTDIQDYSSLVLLHLVESPPPPSRPPKGIIKNKFKSIGEGLRRLKKQRVQIKTSKEEREMFHIICEFPSFTMF